jgi:hypothetical protein
MSSTRLAVIDVHEGSRVHLEGLLHLASLADIDAAEHRVLVFNPDDLEYP